MTEKYIHRNLESEIIEESVEETVEPEIIEEENDYKQIKMI